MGDASPYAGFRVALLSRASSLMSSFWHVSTMDGDVDGVIRTIANHAGWNLHARAYNHSEAVVRKLSTYAERHVDLAGRANSLDGMIAFLDGEIERISHTHTHTQGGKQKGEGKYEGF